MKPLQHCHAHSFNNDGTTASQHIPTYPLEDPRLPHSCCRDAQPNTCLLQPRHGVGMCLQMVLAVMLCTQPKLSSPACTSLLCSTNPSLLQDLVQHPFMGRQHSLEGCSHCQRSLHHALRAQWARGALAGGRKTPESLAMQMSFGSSGTGELALLNAG